MTDEGRFLDAQTRPSCDISGGDVLIRYPIGEADPAYTDEEVDSVRPDQSHGFKYVNVSTSPIPPSYESDSSDPTRKGLGLPAGTTLILTPKPTSTGATLDGIHVDWSWGETGGTQVLPIHATFADGRCTVE